MADEQKAWRCTLCGYVHHGPTPPEFCPICGAAATDFEPYEESSIAPVEPSSTRWRCLNCGYMHEGDSAPDMCTICGVGPEEFEHLPNAESGTGAPRQPIKAVIVGGGVAGVSAAEAIRDASEISKITLVSHEPRPPYYRLNLTRYLAGEIDTAALTIHEASWYNDNNIELLTGSRIVSFSADSQTVEMANGDTLHYDKLILAMGSHPFMPPIPGIDLDGVFSLRTADDADAILARASGGFPCVCIGGGILGMETAGALAKRGSDVTLLESHEWLMPRQLNKQAAAIVESHLSDIGVKLRKNSHTLELRGDTDAVSKVVLQDGDEIECGMVVICTGVRPNTHLARKAGLEVDRGIVVDNHLTTSDPDVLAAGDVAEYNGTVYGIWGPSKFQGTIAGLNAVGIETPFGGVSRSNSLKVLGVELFSIGQFIPLDGSYQVFCEHEGGVFQHFVFHDGKMVGCILIGNTEPASKIKSAIEGKMDFSGLLSGTPDCATIIEHL